MRNIRAITVVPNLPERIAPLLEVAYNLWWTWTHDAQELFRRVDPECWEACRHNPVALLGRTSQRRLQEISGDEGFLAHMDRIKATLDEYMRAKTWYQSEGGAEAGAGTNIAYFSAEFGLHESIPIYSGGLGLLSGDHLKSASGLGLPFVGVGLYYFNGYCRQYLNADGWQQEFVEANDFHNMPSKRVRGKDGLPLQVRVELPEPKREIVLQIWKLQVGRIVLYLLDSRIPENNPEDQLLTGQLYAGDVEHRIKQEIILGIGGIRALRKLGIEPQVCHMNEGHSAFLALECMRERVLELGMTFDQARESVSAGNVFTTHTPVPAGIDRFSADMIDRYFKDWYEILKCDRKTFLALGRKNPHDNEEPFSMAILALKTAGCANGVSKLHGAVSRSMWKNIWPEVPQHEIPITSITNGCHIRSYVSDTLNELYIRYAGSRWSYEAGVLENEWKGPEQLPDSELWRVHERRRWSLVTWARKRLKQQQKKRNAGPREMAQADEVLDPEALTLGFARRFATYKRGALLFRELEHLERLLNNKDRPVQIIFAGKAHPKDVEGKKLIQKIAHFAREERFRKHVVFLEDYEIEVARYLVQGVDVWLNTPRRPMEASGTSGMKAAANGALNCSILDGWWCEGYDGTNGWAIGGGEEYEDHEYQDQVECQALFQVLEREVIPLFYDRGVDGLPRGWIARMKRAMKTCIPQFSTIRMVREYAQRMYLPAGKRWAALNAEGGKGAKALWDWKLSLFKSWAQIRIEKAGAVNGEEINVGRHLEVEAHVHLGQINPDSVEVQAFYGHVDDSGSIIEGQPHPLESENSAPADGMYLFKGKISCVGTGRFGYTFRVIPKHEGLPTPFVPGLITWG